MTTHPKSKKRPVVWILIYEHKFGTDYGAYSTENKALRAAASIILSWISDLDLKDSKAVKDIRKALSERKFTEAMKMWTDKMDEYFEIGEREVG